MNRKTAILLAGVGLAGVSFVPAEAVNALFNASAPTALPSAEPGPVAQVRIVDRASGRIKVVAQADVAPRDSSLGPEVVDWLSQPPEPFGATVPTVVVATDAPPAYAPQVPAFATPAPLPVATGGSEVLEPSLPAAFVSPSQPSMTTPRQARPAPDLEVALLPVAKPQRAVRDDDDDKDEDRGTPRATPEPTPSPEPAPPAAEPSPPEPPQAEPEPEPQVEEPPPEPPQAEEPASPDDEPSDEPSEPEASEADNGADDRASEEPAP